MYSAVKKDILSHSQALPAAMSILSMSSWNGDYHKQRRTYLSPKTSRFWSLLKVSLSLKIPHCRLCLVTAALHLLWSRGSHQVMSDLQPKHPPGLEITLILKKRLFCLLFLYPCLMILLMQLQGSVLHCSPPEALPAVSSHKELMTGGGL